LTAGASTASASSRFSIKRIAPHGSTTRYALILGMMTTLSAFGIDAYLPAFREIARSLQVNEGAVQFSLVSYFVALAMGQAVYGPISDRVGRRGPLIFGFGLFVLASAACAFATTIEWLVAMRFVQGIGACAGMVLTRAIVRDLRSGEEAARLFALMLLVLSVSPILAPMLGSMLLYFLPWQSVFWFMAAFGVFCLALILLLLEETNPPARRSGGLTRAFLQYGALARDGWFMVAVLIGGASQGALFAYLVGSPFVYLELHGITPGAYSALFALNAVALIGSAQANVRLIRRFGTNRLILAASLTQTTAAMILLIVTLMHWDSAANIAALLFVTVGCQGLLGPTTAVLALERYAASAGAASALMGTLQFACGAIAGGLISFFANGTALPFGAVIAGCAGMGLMLAVINLKRSADLPVAPIAHQV
jgi:DHA1 family bicyclomycin/chloramphenicol resistance-like MFS transporter